jgi:hypothetical protein
MEVTKWLKASDIETVPAALETPPLAGRLADHHLDWRETRIRNPYFAFANSRRTSAWQG